MLIFLIFPLLTILGFANLFSCRANLRLSWSVCSAVAMLIIFQTISALLGTLYISSIALLAMGSMLFFYYFSKACLQYRCDQSAKILVQINLLFLITGAVIAIYDINLHYVIIDDYAYWGVISKYLYLNNRLPGVSDQVLLRHLAYTPGLAAFHYMFYLCAGRFSVWAGHLAQGILFFSGVLVLFDARNRVNSVVAIMFAVLICTLTFGTVLARMQADAFLAIYTFAIVWMIIQAETNSEKMLATAIPIMSLYFIKEIGIFSALLCIFLLYFGRKKELTTNYRYLIAIGALSAAVFFLKLTWSLHVTSAHIGRFDRAINAHSILQAINPFITTSFLAQTLFLSKVFRESLDKTIGFTYYFWVIPLLLSWVYIKKKNLFADIKPVRAIIICYLCALIIYLFMLYLLQTIVFGLGTLRTNLPSNGRYFNILFVPFMLLLFELALQVFMSRCKKPLLKSSILLSVLCIPAAIIGKVQHRHSTFDPIINLSSQIIKTMNPKDNEHYCLAGFVGYGEDYNLQLPMQFKMLKQFVSYIPNLNNIPNNCDYIVYYQAVELPKIIFQHDKLLAQFPYAPGKVGVYASHP